MVSVTNSVGLDYHQDSVQVCVLSSGGEVLANRSCPNEYAVIRTVAEQWGAVGEVAIESCNGAADLAEELITHAGWSVSLAHPGYVKRMKQNPDKTDYSDARMLADLVRVGYLPRVWLAPRDVLDLREVTRYRQELANQRRNEKLRIGALLRKHRVGRAPARAWTQAWLNWLDGLSLRETTRRIIQKHLERIRQLNQEIAESVTWLKGMTDDDPVVQRLMGFKGIGLVTACLLRAEIGHFDRFRSGKQLARFCGLTPQNASSGARQADAGLIRASNRALRTALVEAAQRLMRFDPASMALRRRLARAGKKHNVIVAAVANRWVRRLYHSMQPGAAA
jgi:transposase